MHCELQVQISDATPVKLWYRDQSDADACKYLDFETEEAVLCA